MCGIGAFFFRESGGNPELVEPLFRATHLRGRDGFGFVLKNVNNKLNLMTRFKTKRQVSNFDLVKELIGRFSIGDLYLSIHRAAPETETEVDEYNLEETCQPIVVDDLILVHNGAISKPITDELKQCYKFKTKIDSEAIIAAYLKFDRNILDAVEYLSGGFSFLLYDGSKNKLYAVTSHTPLYSGYIRGYGLIYCSLLEGITNTISKIKNIDVKKCGMNVWEDYYFHKVKPYTIEEIDLDSGMVNSIPFRPRYITNKYDSYKVKHKGSVVLVAASGGLDSSTALALLKEKRMNPIAIHFKYGHRGQDAELLAIKKITEILDVPLVVFDIEENMRKLDIGMLTDKNSRIITGTDEGLKTTAAWTVFRNHLFLTYMAAYAEKLIMTEHYDTVYLTGGFMQLTESGVYPDNTERFIEAGIEFFKFSVTGTRIKPYYGFSNMLKTEEIEYLIDRKLYDKLMPWIVSCDRPIVKTIETPSGPMDVPCNCSTKDGIPACGSGLLSYVAMKRCGVEDLRRYYVVDDKDWSVSESYIMTQQKFRGCPY